MKHNRRLMILCVGILCTALLGGCRIRSPRDYWYVDSKYRTEIRSVAVLPLRNLSSEVNAGLIITNLLMAEVVGLGRFRVVKYGDLREFLLQRHMTSVSTVDIGVLHELRKEFRIDAVITGTVFEYGDGPEASGNGRDKETPPPVIFVSCSILDTRTGRILARGEFHEKGAARGYLLSDRERQGAFSLAQGLAHNLIRVLFTDEA
ncbi:MAG: hypothetical protein ACMUIL_07195 [bacterium]